MSRQFTLPFGTVGGPDKTPESTGAASTMADPTTPPIPEDTMDVEEDSDNESDEELLLTQVFNPNINYLEIDESAITKTQAFNYLAWLIRNNTAAVSDEVTRLRSEVSTLKATLNSIYNHTQRIPTDLTTVNRQLTDINTRIGQQTLPTPAPQPKKTAAPREQNAPKKAQQQQQQQQQQKKQQPQTQKSYASAAATGSEIEGDWKISKVMKKKKVPLFNPAFSKVNREIVVKTATNILSTITDNAILFHVNKELEQQQQRALMAKKIGCNTITH